MMRLLKGFATVGGATIASRLLGFAREVMIAGLLGAGPIADAFYAAFRFPNLFRRLFAEGAFNTAFVPLFAKELEGGGREAAQLFARDVFSFLFVILLIVTAFAELTMPWLVSMVIAPGFGEGTDKTILTIDLARIMFPYLLCMSLVAMLSGVLNSFRHYFIAAFVPVLLNIIMIAVLAICVIWNTGNTATTVYFMSWGVFVAGFAQLLLVWVAVRRIGFQLRFGISGLTPPVKRVLVLAFPAAIAGGITQINLLVGQIIASVQDGAITFLQLADRIYQLPLGVIGIAIGVVLLPELSRDLKAGNKEKAGETQNQALEFSMFFTLPSALALMIMPGLIVSTLYERGAFDNLATQGTASALAAFAVGLPAFVLIKVLSPGFFAREDTRTPMIYAAINAGVNIVLSLILFQYFAHVGIAIATSVAGWVNVGLLVTGLVTKGYWPLSPTSAKRCTMMLVAALGMGLVLWLGFDQAVNQGWTTSFTGRALVLILMVVLGAATYFVLCRLTGGVNFGQILRNMRRSDTDKASGSI